MMRYLAPLGMTLMQALVLVLVPGVRITTAGTPYWREYQHTLFSGIGAIAGQVDCDNDGYDDAVMGAPNEANGGTVWIYSNRTGALLHTIPSPAGAIKFGSEVENLGDINGDNHDDVLIAANRSGFVSGQEYRGRRWVYSGSDATVLFDQEGSGCPYYAAGAVYKLDGGADIDGDGTPDYVVDNNGCGTFDFGKLLIIRLPSGDTLFDITPPYETAYSVMLGDVTGDSRDDFAAGNGGQAQIYSGVTGTSVKTLSLSVTNPTGLASADPLADAGDVDGDGINDVIAHGPEDLYHVTVYKGGTFVPLYQIINVDSSHFSFGFNVTGLGDVNGDNLSDVAVSSVESPSWFGVFSGADGSIIASDTVAVGSFYLIAAAGDANGDGYGDLLAQVNGRVRVYLFSPDTDGDGVMDVHDNCPSAPNTNQSDADADGFGDLCDCVLEGGINDPDVNPATAWYPDADGDGYGDASAVSIVGCDPGAGSFVPNDSSDCNDVDACVNPGTHWYLDLDGDGHGDPATEQIQCDTPVTGLPFVCNVGDDCDDTDAGVFAEQEWYEDADGDGYGVSSNSVLSCASPGVGWAPAINGEDCSDSDPAVNPGATEICNGVDDNCNGQVDEGFGGDDDGDGHGLDCDNCPALATPGNVTILTGDVNLTGTHTSADIISMVNYVFKSGAEPLPCRAAADVDCNNSVTSGDIIRMVNFVFKSGDPPCSVCDAVPGTLTLCP